MPLFVSVFFAKHILFAALDAIKGINVDAYMNLGNRQISMLSPSLAICQKGMSRSTANSRKRQAEAKPLRTKCMGTNRPTRKRSMNWRAPRV